MVRERLQKLRAEMAKRNIDIYVVPTADFHESEYVGEHFKARKFITGFTGSAGTAVITMTEAGLWTDGRYFLQAEDQLKDSTIDLYKDGIVQEIANKYGLTDSGVLAKDIGRIASWASCALFLVLNTRRRAG